MSTQSHGITLDAVSLNGVPPSRRGYELKSLTIGGVQIDPATLTYEGSAMLQVWDAAAHRFIRRLYGHHLPKRLRKK